MILLIRKRTLLYTWLAVCMIGLSAIFLAGSRRAFTPTGAMGQGSSAQTVVIDPGHGGQDGGAVAETVRRKAGSIWRFPCSWNSSCALPVFGRN